MPMQRGAGAWSPVPVTGSGTVVVFEQSWSSTLQLTASAQVQGLTSVDVGAVSSIAAIKAVDQHRPTWLYQAYNQLNNRMGLMNRASITETAVISIMCTKLHVQQYIDVAQRIFHMTLLSASVNFILLLINQMEKYVRQRITTFSSM